MMQTFGNSIIFKVMLLLSVMSLDSIYSTTVVSSPLTDNELHVKKISSMRELKVTMEESQEKLILFDLYADWCLPCRILSPLLEEIAREKKHQVIAFKVDVDKNPEIAGAFGVTGIPFVVLVKNKTAVHAFTGVQSRDTYIRAIDQYSQKDGSIPKDLPDGELVEGVRVISMTTATTPGNVYVFRGETVKLVIGKVDFHYSIHIPEYKISKDGIVGQDLEVTFKAKKTGVFPVFCNGQCPAGDGARHGQIVVMPFEPSKKVHYKEITSEQAQKLFSQDKIFLLDVRTPNEYYQGHIKGAKLIPLQQLKQRISELSAYRNKDVLVYCRSGNRSVVASQILIDSGFKKIYHLKHGLITWMKDGYPVNK